MVYERMVIVIKREGHSHTEFCPHGSGDDVELMIQKAIKLGFEEYSITEHAPLPEGLADKYAGKTTGLTEASMAAADLDAYFQKANQMKAKYADQIKINIGFEVDFLPDFVDWTRDFLNEYGPRTTDNILSYFQTVLASVNADLGPYTPNRIGHMTLVKKFQDYFGLDRNFSENNLRLVDQILKAVSGQHRELDLNAAGLYKPYCNEQYPSYSVIQMAKSLNIPFVYGSDAHSIAEVGQGYNGVISLVE
ncbi:histidinol-phosphatase HisJ [Lentilactobacillus buchneri]|nr:histidinol-phosphatase HisJ [Lentilactobacillus sp. Egmn17]